ARPRVPVRPGQPGGRQPPRRRAADPADPPRDPPPVHRPVPAAGRTRYAAPLVTLATTAPGHRPELPLPKTSPCTRMISKCRWSIRSQSARFGVIGTGRGRGIVLLYPDKLAVVNSSAQLWGIFLGPIVLLTVSHLLFRDIRVLGSAVGVLAGNLI